jgi:hypothetical protein
MSEKKNVGRPPKSNMVQIVPEFHEKPDIEKLVGVLISIASRLAKKPKESKAA